MVRILLTILLVNLISVGAGWLYFLGGQGGTWWKNTNVRDCGVPTLGIVILTILFGWNLVYLLCWGAYFGALRLSFKKKGEPELWYNWTAMGAGYALAMIPYAFITGRWEGFLIRIAVCAAGIGTASTLIQKVKPQAIVRGFIASVTLLFL